MLFDHIPQGEVDARSIADVKPEDLKGFTQCHFFAGISGWSYTLKLAKFPEDREVWTGSCPCQPFSVAGKQKGNSDERHLWPVWFDLIRQCKPDLVFGEQVAGAISHGWLDGIQTDLEAEGYAVGHCVLGAHSVGAPHIRQRLYWLGLANSKRRKPGQSPSKTTRQRYSVKPTSSSTDSGLADADGGNAETERLQRSRQQRQQPQDGGASKRLAVAESQQQHRSRNARRGRRKSSDGSGVGSPDNKGSQGRSEHAGKHANQLSPWAAGEFIHCVDGKARRAPISQSTFLFMDDGLLYRMADVRASCAEKIVSEVKTYAAVTKSRPEKIVSLVRNALDPNTLWQKIGRPNGIPTPKILFDLLRDVLSTLNRAADGGCGAQTSAQNDRRMLRSVWDDIESLLPPCRREPGEQRGAQPTDSLYELSQFLARCGETCWRLSCRTNAVAFPLAGKVVNRISILRGAGNAIVPQVAQAFIEAFLDIEGDL